MGKIADRYKNPYLQEMYGDLKIKEYNHVKSEYKIISNNDQYPVLKQQLIVLSGGNVQVPPQNEIDFVKHKFVATIFYVDNKPYDALIYDPLHEYTDGIELEDDEESKNFGWGFVTGIVLDDDKLRELGLTIKQIDYLWSSLDWYR